MNRLIRADLKRILAKPGLYVPVVLMVLVVLLKDPAFTAADQIQFYQMLFLSLGLTFLCIPIYLSVYTDELKSGIMISVIGMGMARNRIVRSKLQDVFILLLGSYLILFGAAVLKNTMAGFVVTQRQNLFLFIFCLFCVVRGIGIMALASLVLFYTMSASGGMLVLVVAGSMASLFLKGAQNFTRFPFYDMSYIGRLDDAYAQLQNGTVNGSFIVAMIYLAAVIAVNIITFDRKEMDL